MVLRCFFLLLGCFISAEMRSIMSISQDLSIIMRCNSTFSVDKRTLNVALIDKHFDPDLDQNFKCFLHCLYHNYKWMDTDGAFQYENMKNNLIETNLDEPSIEFLLATCTETEAEDKCERARSFTECFWFESNKLELTKDYNFY